ncbi:MAG: LamG domain-containing protein [Planctomycetia bacterium]|nr:LamG domain-containing protein [Planctomycetia bacterium]
MKHKWIFALSWGLLVGTATAEMVGFWNFDGGSTANSISGHTDLVGGGTYFLENDIFTAAGGYLSGGSNAANLPTGTSPYTVSVFLNTTTTTNCDLVSWGNNTYSNSTGFRLDNDGVNIREYWWGIDFTANTTVTPANSGTWNHIVIGSEGNNQLVFLNGQRIGTNTPSSTHNQRNESFYIGSRHAPSANLTGSMDDVSIYNTCLLHSEIIDLSASRYNNLVGWWNTADVSDNTNIVDRVGGISKTTAELQNLSVDSSKQTLLYNGATQAASTEFRLFDRVLTASEKTYYQGQMASGHSYTLQTGDGPLSTATGTTTWVQNGTATFDSSVTTSPLGLYVGGNTDSSVVNMNTSKINAANMMLVLAGGTLNLVGDTTTSSFTAISVNFTRTLNIDGGSFEVQAKNNYGSGTDSTLAYLNLQGGSRVTVSSGSATTGYMRIGDNGTGEANFVLNGGTVNSTQIHVGDHSANSTVGVLTVNGGTLTLSGELVIGQNAATGYFYMNGGTVESGNLSVGRNASSGTLTQTGGIVNASTLTVGHSGTDKQGAGTVLLNTLNVGSQDHAAENTVNLSGAVVVNQGTLTVDTLNIHTSSVNVRDTLQVHKLTGATTSNLQFTSLGANPNQSTLAMINALATGDAPTYSGNFAFTPAVLQIGVDENELTTFTIDGDYTQSANTTLEININALDNTWDKLFVTEGNTLNFAGTLDLILGDAGESLYAFQLFDGTIASTFSQILVNGAAASDRWNFSGLNAGGNGIVTFNNTPEPSSWILLLLALAGAYRRRRFC